ncbi:GNAT family N-acetyltransferase [Ascidiimonas aurantiaca]|uniref:GNAT family N-acetyltransferase n=1 Tax=Ascidiimonas aurantiaca TaxID=1685432 RepID=UPI0030EEAFF3
MDISFRLATPKDLNLIVELFKETITHINKKDYTPEQIKVWASGASDREKWLSRIRDDYFSLAFYGERLAGFAFLAGNDYFDGLFVHKDFQRKGIAQKLLMKIEERARNNRSAIIRSDVSITALPFFLKNGYLITEKQQKSKKGVLFENYLIYKDL